MKRITQQERILKLIFEKGKKVKNMDLASEMGITHRASHQLAHNLFRRGLIKKTIIIERTSRSTKPVRVAYYEILPYRKEKILEILNKAIMKE